MIRNRMMVLFLAALFGGAATASDQIELLKTVVVPGVQRDRSGFKQELKSGLAHDLFGGISALEYVGKDDLYFALPDRGPLDGAVDWSCRVHIVRIDLASDSNSGEFSVQETLMLRDKDRRFPGSHSRFTATKNEMSRLDPEGIRLRSGSSFFLSDEYGPHLLEFDRSGMLIQELTVPDHFKVKVPCRTKAEENHSNQSGRQCNRGMEGLAISKDKKTLFGLFQSPLLQDCEWSPKDKPTGVNCRLVEFRVDDGKHREFVYQLDHPKNKLNEILTYDDSQFLVIERDGESGRESQFKKIVKINIEDATELKNRSKLPAGKLPDDIKPVSKETYIDLLDPKYGLSGDAMPEKIEGLTFGPTLADGHRTLLVASDNDFKVDQPTLVYCFAIGKADSGRTTNASKKITTR